MLKKFIVVILLTSCSSIPNKGNVVMVKTMQRNNKEEKQKYVFCVVSEIDNHKCPEITKKTPAFEPGDVEVNVGVDLNMSQESNDKLLLNLLFNFASNEMIEKSKNDLKQNISLLKGKKLNLHGYTDNIGMDEANAKLAVSRAEKIKQVLVENGCLENEISTEGHPLCCYENQNHNDEERQKNRRVEIYLSH